MPEQTRPRSQRGLVTIVIVLTLLAAAWGIFSRWHASSSLHERTQEDAIPKVTAVKAESGPAVEEVVLPGNAQAWHESPIYARTSGYLKDWKTDIGAHVQQGDLLAEIETPEVDAQTHQAEADLATVEANSKLAQSTAKRWLALLKTNSVSRQETDEKVSDARAKAAQAASARANLDRLRQLESFKRVIAPFTGTVTVRNTDTGALINAGAGAELFRVAEMTRLRVYTQVPENYAGGIESGAKAELHFPAHPGRAFTGELVDTAHAIDPAARTLLVQFAVDNRSGELMPGGYAEVHIKLPGRAASVRLPVNALLFRAQGIQAVIVDDEDKIHLKNIKVGRDFGKEVEVLAGIEPGNRFVINPPDSIAEGEKVRVMTSDEDEKGSPAAQAKPSQENSGGNDKNAQSEADSKKAKKSEDGMDAKNPKSKNVSKDGISIDKKTGEIKNTGTEKSAGKDDTKSDAKKLGATDRKAGTAGDSGRLTAGPESLNGENPAAAKDAKK